MDKSTIRNSFIEYLKANYNYARPEIMASNVFYAFNNPIGMDFWSIFESEANLLKGKYLLEMKFIEVNRKNPRGHASVHYGCWIKFKEFLDQRYNGVSKLRDDNMLF
ncbi:hypothetical protein [Petrocella sp. FN5]|uniref:hypothetical protein n=1 Tax=Petrocella sp. FN5 TaxID=3032002 RepID=UPI0023DAFE64|nr:hypothetical protein [Petrocella sp. FN5]MDF1618245.1 hypothetical protein [Petrocella sp. FN5]